MKDLARLYGTSAKLEQEGVDLHVGADAYITVKRAGGSNRAFAEAFRRVTRPHQKAIERGDLDPETDDALGVEIFSRAVVIGWRGVVVNGQEIPFSVENFKRVMRELPELWRVVRDEARNAANFRDDEVTEAGKPSAPS